MPDPRIQDGEGREEDDDRFWDDEEDDDGYERDCHFCGGEGWHECLDQIQCTRPHNRFGECQCSSCGGSGLAKDMTIW